MTRFRMRVAAGVAGLVFLMASGVSADAQPQYITAVQLTVIGRIATTRAKTHAHYHIDYAFLVQNTQGQWHTIRGYQPGTQVSVPAGTIAVQAEALTSYAAAHHQWGSAVRSAVVAVPLLPTLAAQVAQQSVASITTIKSNLDNPSVLGTLKWSTADAQTVGQALGSISAPASTTENYAETFVYAFAALNRSIFRWPFTAPGLFTVQGTPANIASVQHVSLTGVKKLPQELNYFFAVRLTTTAGVVRTDQFGVILEPNRSGTQWMCGYAEDASAQWLDPGPVPPLPSVAPNSLAYKVAHAPVATLRLVRKDLAYPGKLGLLKWSRPAAETIEQSLGNISDPASTTERYAETYVYAIAALNRSVFEYPIAGPVNLQMQGMATNIARIDHVALRRVQHTQGALQYYFNVKLVTTAGVVRTDEFGVTLQPGPMDAHWMGAGAGDLTTEAAAPPA